MKRLNDFLQRLNWLRTKLSELVSTVRHIMKGRHKGVLTANNRKRRTQFANKVVRLLGDKFWKIGVSFYFGGVTFAHKTNPLADASAPPTMMWRKRREGLKFTCKGKKEGSGRKVAHFFVAIAYGKGVILCEQYLELLSGEMFQNFVRTYFLQHLRKVPIQGKSYLYRRVIHPRTAKKLKQLSVM